MTTSTQPSMIVAGVDVGGTRTKIGLVQRAGGNVLAQCALPTVTTSRSDFLDALHNALDDLQTQAGARIQAIGFGLPGYVDGNAVSQLWERLRFLEGDDFRRDVETALGVPCRMDNDARVAGLGEAQYGAGCGVARFILLTLGTGVGFAQLQAGALVELSSRAHLAGHIVIRDTGWGCFCGLEGCLESRVSATAIATAYRARTGRDASAEHIFLLAGERKDQHAVAVIDEMLDDLARGLNSYAHLFAPDVIALGGGVARGLESHLPELQRRIVAKPFDDYRVAITLSQLGDMAGVLGAAAL